MTFYILVRGPLGVGKSVVSKELAQRVRGVRISIDDILDRRGLWYDGALSEFIGANVFASRQARVLLDAGRPVVFDGNFYWKSQIADLIRRLPYVHRVFTLDAPLSTCVRRDGRRAHPHGPAAAAEVYRKTRRFEYGTRVDATVSVDRVVRRMLARLPPGGDGREPSRLGPVSRRKEGRKGRG